MCIQKITALIFAVSDLLSGILGEPVDVKLLLCLLGVIPLTLEIHETYPPPSNAGGVARKAIKIRWVGDQPPTIDLWESLISNLKSLKKLGIPCQRQIRVNYNTRVNL